MHHLHEFKTHLELIEMAKLFYLNRSNVEVGLYKQFVKETQGLKQ